MSWQNFWGVFFYDLEVRHKHGEPPVVPLSLPFVLCHLRIAILLSLLLSLLTSLLFILV